MAGSDEIKIEVYSSVRHVDDAPEEPGGILVKYVYQLDAVYTPTKKEEKALFLGLVEMNTYAKPKAVHPWVGKPVYLVVTRGDVQVGKTIYFYSGASVGFYLLDNVVRGDSGLSGELDYEHAYPVSSKPFSAFLNKTLGFKERGT